MVYGVAADIYQKANAAFLTELPIPGKDHVQNGAAAEAHSVLQGGRTLQLRDIAGRLPLLSTLFELTLLAAILLLCWCCSRDERDFLALALLILLLFSVLLGHSGLSRLLDNPLSAFLGQISYGFYLNQCFFLHIFGPVIPVRPYWRTAALFLACNFVLSILTYYLSQGVAALLRRGADSLCRPSDR